jgi:hypothetical protein
MCAVMVSNCLYSRFLMQKHAFWLFTPSLVPLSRLFFVLPFNTALCCTCGRMGAFFSCVKCCPLGHVICSWEDNMSV